MVHKYRVIAVILIAAFPAVSFAQYGNYGGGGGGGGGGGSIGDGASFSTQSTTTSSVLVKDTCPDGDRSGSTYDNLCTGNREPIHSSAPENPGIEKTSTPFVTQSVVSGLRGQLQRIQAESNEPQEEWIPARKAKIKQMLDIKQESIIVLPLGYEKVQSRLDPLFIKVNKLTDNERQQKFIKIANTIKKIQGTALWNNVRVRTILQYVQDRIIMMIQI